MTSLVPVHLYLLVALTEKKGFACKEEGVEVVLGILLVMVGVDLGMFVALDCFVLKVPVAEVAVLSLHMMAEPACQASAGCYLALFLEAIVVPVVKACFPHSLLPMEVLMMRM
eukprot:15364341-Ditylum_brightwellii.AAC.2